MNANRRRLWITIATLLFSIMCTSRWSVQAQSPFPKLTLQPGDFYFSIDGTPAFIFARNVTGYDQSHFNTILNWAKVGGTKLARVQLDSLGMGMTKSGALDEFWAKRWEAVFDKAYANGIYVLPVFSGWFDWNNGTPNYGYSTWKQNPLNSANGGPASTPAELFKKDSATQKLWLQWMAGLVKRWQARENIAAWEIFSEINIATGTTQAISIDFLNQATSLIHAADPTFRPITLSLADVGEWADFYRSKALDFIEIHPYPWSGKLDTTILSSVGQKLALYNKPVLIGESGLSASTPDSKPETLTTAANAVVGIRHAIWAGVVSGAMNGRMLYWEDSFGVYFNALSFSWMQQYADLELPAAIFLKDVSFSGFKPLSVRLSGAPLVVGGAVGSETAAIGWFRDLRCEPPDWKLQPKISAQKVTLIVPGTAANWQVDFYDTHTGKLLSSVSVTRQGTGVPIPLPDFTDDIAFKMAAKP